MQKCKNCNTPFSWSSIYKSFWLGYKPIGCENCNTEHRITVLGRLKFVSLTIIPMLVFGHFFSPFDNAFSTIGVGIAILIIGSLFTPYFVKYKKVAQ
ncbi:TIGR04104 family putative zinc finger protein [Sutcliffiella sp. NPDC057660]|uniref:TIGR04104 family putative zinc finger protein n=1 Tax=Sutcliffiella sp. NPDC057660 TaxID=3346199 RepID=UPI00368B06EE